MLIRKCSNYSAKGMLVLQGMICKFVRVNWIIIMKWFGKTWLAAALFSAILSGCGQQSGNDEADLALLRDWISTIGSDEFGGRCPMTEYEDKTIGYLASEMEKLGLEPAFDGEWFQDVGMITTISRPDDGLTSFES